MLRALFIRLNRIESERAKATGAPAPVDAHPEGEAAPSAAAAPAARRRRRRPAAPLDPPMPADLNRVTLVGRLTRDPELRHTGGGDPICSIRLAVSSRSRDEGGNWGDRSNYFDVTVFGRQAETASTYLAKGRRIGVDGRLSWREWQAQDGTKRQSSR